VIWCGFLRFNYQQAASTKLTTWLQASWDNFTDAQSGVQGYTVEFIQLVSLSFQDLLVCNKNSTFYLADVGIPAICRFLLL
jgi:hypothetical protein